MKSPDRHKKSKSQLEPITISNQSKVISMGLLDLDLTLTLTEADVLLFKLSYENFKSRSYLKEFFEVYFLFLDRIVLSSQNESVTTALYLNKVQFKKTFIEFLTLNKMEFLEEDLFMKDIIKYLIMGMCLV